MKYCPIKRMKRRNTVHGKQTEIVEPLNTRARTHINMDAATAGKQSLCKHGNSNRKIILCHLLLAHDSTECL